MVVRLDLLMHVSAELRGPFVLTFEQPFADAPRVPLFSHTSIITTRVEVGVWRAAPLRWTLSHPGRSVRSLTARPPHVRGRPMWTSPFRTGRGAPHIFGPEDGK